MRKHLIFILASLMCLLLAACQGETKVGNTHVTGDVVNIHGSVEGLENMEGFLDSTENKEKSHIKITHYTTEGDPIYTDLSYEEDVYTVKHDYTKDSYGSGGIQTFTCQNFIKEETPVSLSYIVTDCDKSNFKMDRILYVEYDLSRQDLFEVQLKYGIDLENDINTIEKEMTKILNVKETLHVSDFDLPHKVKQKIFKRLVLANYLDEEAPLKTDCDAEDYMKYHLLVKINGGSKEFKWSACETSDKGNKLTDMAEYMIKASELEPGSVQDVYIQGYIVDVSEEEILIAENLNKFDYELLKDYSHQEWMETYQLNLISVRHNDKRKLAKGTKVLVKTNGNMMESMPMKATAERIEIME
ncbi:DUF4362 domain-containing protein [Cytobacillus sp. FJAT-54145]|uniref:DUF4362 domain-containing protein n=1 Tax=Cytobacillus spartinae TaxID=3299023 RepID=A0ABW6KCZ3_9BACI